MSTEAFNTMRKELAESVTLSALDWLAYMGTSAALAAIPDTNPPRYVVAGTLADIVKLLPAESSVPPLTAPAPLTDELRTLVDHIADLFNIGSEARTPSTILTNVRNTIRRAECLVAVERQFFMAPLPPDDDYPDDEPGETCLLNWGDTPEQYAQQFGEVLPLVAPAPLADAEKLIAEARAVFDLMLEGCREQNFGDFQNGDGEEIGPRMDALHARLRAYQAAPAPQQSESIDIERFEAVCPEVYTDAERELLWKGWQLAKGAPAAPVQTAVNIGEQTVLAELPDIFSNLRKAYRRGASEQGADAGEYKAAEDIMRGWDLPDAVAATVQAEPVATVIKKGAEWQWMSESLGNLPDGMYSLYLNVPALPAQAEQVVAVRAARHPVQPLVIAEHGRVRFKRNHIVEHLAEGRLNDLAAMDFSQEDWEQLAQLIGYSLDGFGTLSYVTDETYERAASQDPITSPSTATSNDTGALGEGAKA